MSVPALRKSISHTLITQLRDRRLSHRALAKHRVIQPTTHMNSPSKASLTL